jgi:transcriptional regulator with XRE-family HTH domain
VENKRRRSARHETPPNETPAQRFGRAVRDFREARGWSQDHLAERLEQLTGRKFKSRQSMIAKTEAAERPVLLNEAAALSVIFDQPLEVMLATDELPEWAAEIARLEDLIERMDEQILLIERERDQRSRQLRELKTRVLERARATRRTSVEEGDS